MFEAQTILIILGVLVFGITAGFFLNSFLSKNKFKKADSEIKDMFEKAKREIDADRKEMEVSLKDKLYQQKSQFDEESKAKIAEIAEREKQLIAKEDNMEKRLDFILQKERDIEVAQKEIVNSEKIIEEKKSKYDSLFQEQLSELERLSRLSIDEAKDLLLKKTENEMKFQLDSKLREQEQELKSKSEKLAQRIISLAIQRTAASHTQETTVKTVSLESDELKGRIIGREGRNIRALEQETGCDIIIDDTPETVIVSGFDPVRREVAKITLERLLADGRIHPTRIEEVCQKVREEVQERIVQLGEAALIETGIMGVHPEIVKLLGRLHYRTSFGQNVLRHSIETAFLMSSMAGELGLDVNLAKRVGLLHDIGKAVDREIEGGHAIIGGDLAKKFHESSEVVHAIAAHHHDIEQDSVYAVLAEAADAISAARPGARGETMQNYISRVEQLEKIATSFDEVEKAYVIQAGREVRCVVEPSKVNDAATSLLARNISNQIQDELQYPGQIKVTVLRETRSVEYAK